MAQKNPLFALRIDVGIGLTVIWNALCLWGIHLNGGMGKIHEPGAIAVMALNCGLISLFCLGTVVSRPFRNLVTAESRRHLYAASAWGLLAALPGLFCLFLLVALLAK